MCESSGASFSGFGLEEICHLPTMEHVMGTGELPQSAQNQAHAGSDEVSARQANSAAPSLGDSQTDPASLIRD